MTAGDWFRALQVPVLPVGVGPVVVGSALGQLDAGRLDVPVLVLSLASVLAIQVGANLQKGLVESKDLASTPSRPASSFVFDAGAVLRTGVRREILERLAMAFFGAGAAAGLVVVALRGDTLLLVMGFAGAFFAYSYSGPPLKLSYRGLGELATFGAFGPLMLWGAYRAQNTTQVTAFIVRSGSTSGGLITGEALWLGIGFGFLTSMVSFARYFPALEEDRRKGKRTPVVRLGMRPSGFVFGILVLGASIAFGALVEYLPAYCAYPGSELSEYPFPPWAAVPLTAGGGLVAVALLGSRKPTAVGAGVAATVLLQVAISALFGARFFSGCLPV